MSESEGFVVVAHRGNSANTPENTIASFDSAVDSGFPHFETDCQLTADGVVVVLHDEQLGRTTPGAQGAVAEAVWADLRDLDAGSWFSPDFASARIPLLADVLQRYHGRAHIHLELKSKQPELPASVARELMKAGWAGGAPEQQPAAAAVAAADADVTAVPMAAVTPQGSSSSNPAQQQPQQRHPDFGVPGMTITSFHLNQLRRSLQALPGVTHGWLVHELTEDVIQEALSAGCRQVCPRANALSADAVRLAIAAGLSVRAWGVKDVQLLLHAVRCGCHGATVNWPREALRELPRLVMKTPAPPAGQADVPAGPT